MTGLQFLPDQFIQPVICPSYSTLEGRAGNRVDLVSPATRLDQGLHFSIEQTLIHSGQLKKGADMIYIKTWNKYEKLLRRCLPMPCLKAVTS